MAEERRDDRGADAQAETRKSRLNRELIELLNELRVALPGVQVLFAFLLTVPFTRRFGTLTLVQRDIYFAALLAAAGASAMFIAPSSYHRLRWRHQDKERMLVTSNVLAIVGLVLLAASMTEAVLLIADLLFGPLIAAITTASAAVLFGWVWFGLPLSRRNEPVHPDDRLPPR